MENTNNITELLPVNIEDEMKRSYLDYAMSVIVSRAIPDARDGLKPVHRRILFAMYEAGYTYNKQHRKSARIVGDVIGKYHPHGDGAVYDSLVRMAQDFSLRLPLIDGQGNFGSIDGDSPAAMRYTESRLEKAAHNLLEDLDKDTVDFQPNYDGTENEPVVIPAVFPNLLVNGGGGIAVGMATNIPPHNLGEVIDACLKYIENPDIDSAEMMEVISGPDFPTGATIMGRAGIKSAFETGRGSIMIRGKAHFEDINNNRQAIVITEIPYMVNKAKLVEKIADLVRDKRIEGISDLRDESNKQGIRVVVELKKDVVGEVILNQLYSYSQLQTSFGINMLALDNGRPRVMNLKDILACFINFREEVITKRTIYLLNKARDKAHLLLGVSIAVDNIDAVIRMIKAAKDPAEAKAQLMATGWDAANVNSLITIIDDRANLGDDGKCYFTEAQAKAILEMRLQRLTAMEKDKIRQDLENLAVEIKGYLNILGSREVLYEVLTDELKKIKEEFATPRLTEISTIDYEQDIEDLIQREEMVVTVTMNGYIKRVPLSTYRSQKRGGKGRAGLSMRDEDVTTQVFVGNTHTPMLFFSNLGQVYKLKLYKLPLGNPQAKGRPLVNLLPLKPGETITNIMPLPENEDEWDNLNIMFATQKGNIRRNSLSDFKRVQANGKIAIRMDEDDNLIGVNVCSDDQHVFLATHKGKCIRFPVSAIRVFKGRTSDGVRGIKLAAEDYVISMAILGEAEFTSEEREQFLKISLAERIKIANEELNPQDLDDEVGLDSDRILTMAQQEQFIITVSEKGYGKMTSAYEYRITNRGGSGIINMIINDKNGEIVASMPVTSKDELMLITDNGKLIRCPIDNVRITGRSAVGVILFKTAEDEKVASVALIADNDDDEPIEGDAEI